MPKPEWYSDYQRSRARFLPIGPEVEIARDTDWSIKVSRAQDGFCISHARSEGGGGYTTGRLPGPGDRSNVVMIFGTPASRKGSVGFIVGIVTPNVARVEVELRDGTRISAPTEVAPDALEADLRTFVIRTPYDEQPFGPGYPPWTREYVLFASDDAVLERRPHSR